MSSIGPPSPQQYARNLLSEHDPRRWRDWWLEITAGATVILLIASVTVRMSRSGGIVVVWRDVTRGSQITPDQIAVAALPALDRSFPETSEMRGLIAARDLAAGTPIRWNDVLRDQAVATADIRIGELVSTDNTAFSPSPYDSHAVTFETQLSRIARSSIPAGSVVRDDMLGRPVAAVQHRSAAPGEIEVPLCVAVGALAIDPGSRVALIVPRPNGDPLIVEPVRVLARNASPLEPSTVIFALKREDAAHVAKLLPTKVYVMRLPPQGTAP